MTKKSLVGATRSVLVLLLAVVLTCSALAMPQVWASEGTGKKAGTSITKLEGLEVDYTQYLDSSKVMPLPAGVRDDQQIAVIITLDTEGTMDAYAGAQGYTNMAQFVLNSQEAADIRSGLQTEKSRILGLLDDRQIAYTLGSDYTVALTGFELTIQARDFEAVCQSLGQNEGIIVSEEYQRAETELVENTVNFYEDTGIFNGAVSGYDGSGMVVAVLDTGLDSNHTAFSVENFTSQKLGLTYEQVAAVLADTKAYEQYKGNLGVDDVYINEKVPYGYDYADNDPDVYSTHNNHGTHVSGVIVGQDDVITGVAPNAQLVSMKTFSDVMDTARSTWILSALEDCVVLGVDVINMSLGTACGFARESDEEILSGVYDKIRAAGISMVVAASNSYSSAFGSEANGNLGLTSNPDTGTVGSPSTYDGTLSVASIAGEETPYILFGETIIYFDESNNNTAEENDFFETLLGDAQSKEYEYVIIPGVGRSADYTGLDMTGKIALVRRGDNTFEEKAIIAEEKGAAGIIIYNNVSGDIKMNVGDAELATCSISQNDGEMLVAAGNGTITISKDQTSGPFISDFSSWGPTPTLNIKPEITGHGGNILSSVTGGSYDRLSGTSMACPNLAGLVILLRQYVVENFPEIAQDDVAVSEMAIRLLMSTADIALNTNGLPYAVRKQGAGLANIVDAVNTPALVITYDQQGEAMDKPKLELGDDPQKTGVYTMKLAVENFGSAAMSYDVGAWVLTEGVSETKTNAGKTTVTEEAVVLEGAQVDVSCLSGGSLNGKTVTVEAGQTAQLSVTVTLTQENKNYLDTSFANGMYVEGFITLTAAEGRELNLNVPFLAFYGDWTQAPMFDLTYYDTNPDELDTAIDDEDKLKADAYATRPIGGVMDDFVSYLGSYYFLQDEDDMPIAANRDYIALSNKEGTIHSLRYVWAGLLRNAQRIEVVITDDATGEVIFETVDTDVRKSYGDGGSIYPANIEIEFDTQDYNLPNNSQYTVTLTGYMDYGEDGGIDTNLNNTFSFPLYVDFEAPTITGVEYYTEYDQTAKKNRLFAKVSIYDNHYTMSAGLGYVGTGKDENDNEVAELYSFEQYMTPVYSQRNSTTVVTYELTDYLYTLKEGSLNDNSFVLTCYDYALNYATYEIALPDDFTDFYFEDLAEGITISPNEVFSLEPVTEPDHQWSELLEYTSNKPSVVRVVNNKLVGTAPGKAVVRARDPQSGKSVVFSVTVLAEGDEGYMRYDKPVADVFTVTGYNTLKAYYQLDSKDKHIGDTGDKRFFEGKYSLEMYPSESVCLTYDLDAFFPNETTLAFETSNDKIVTIDQTGTITAKAEGFASVTVKVLLDGKSTYYSQSITVEVKDPFINNGASLTHYFGLGGTVTFPEDLDVREIGSFAFANFDYVLKTEEELAFDDAETSKQWYIGESTITKVILPEGIEKIGAYAFANLTGLEEIVFPSTLEAIDYGAFYGCTSLERITFSGENNLKIINKSAFEGCDLAQVDLSAACMISAYAFAGNQNLKQVTTGDTLISIGDYAFAGCKKLEEVTITAAKVKYGPYAFTDCEALTSFYVNAAVLPEGMFYECAALEKVTLGPDVNDIGSFAFRDTKVTTYEVLSGNKAYREGSAAYILSADGSELIAVSPMFQESFSAEKLDGAKVTAIGKGAFSHNNKLTSVNLPNVTRIGAYGLGSCTYVETLTLGKLTHIGEYAFFETSISVLPQMAADTVIEKYAFSHTNLKTVAIADGATVSEGAFSQCKELESVTIGNNAVLEDYAFYIDKDTSYKIEHYDEDGERYFYYTFSSALQNLTIGDNVTIGQNVFAGHASLEAVTLGAGAKIGYMAFYNCDSLRYIDLSKAVQIDDYAFSGDVYYICLDDQMSYAAVSSDGFYMYTYHGPNIQTLELGAVTGFGDYAFAYCRELETVTLNENITEIPQYAFAGCISLHTINSEKVTSVGDYAFIESEALEHIDLSSTQTIGEFAFVYGDALTSVTLNPAGVQIGEGAFSYCEKLDKVNNMAGVTDFGDYAFAYTQVTKLDLTGAQALGNHVFMKEQATPVTVTLGSQLTSLGDNPFAMCQVDAFTLFVPDEVVEETTVETTEPTGETVEETIEETVAEATEETTRETTAVTEEATEAATEETAEATEGTGEATEPTGETVEETLPQIPGQWLIGTFDVSETVKVIDGSLYCATGTGLELVTYGATHQKNISVADGTVRITALAFAGSDVKQVSLPASVKSIGHKAFYGCEQLHQVVFASFEAPILEEEFDASYYESLEHIPGTGDFGSYTDYDGTDVTISGMELLPYYMWNSTDGLYSNVFYGANFVDYVGYVDSKLTMVRPVNGQYYDTYIYNQYFDLAIDGASAADAATLAAIEAIKAIPERVTWDTREPVELARAAYNKIATMEQQALVYNYADLISAEQRVTATDPNAGTTQTPTGPTDPDVDATEPSADPTAPTGETAEPVEKDNDTGIVALIAGFVVLVVAGVASARYIFSGSRKEKKEKTAKKVKAEKAPKARKLSKPMKTPSVEDLEAAPKQGLNLRRILRIVLIVILVALLVTAVCLLPSCVGEVGPYAQNDQDGYRVSVKFDANGGLFTTNTSVFVDSYDISKLTPGGSGMVELPVVEPENPVRELDAYTATNNGYFLAGWYAQRTEHTDASGNTYYTYADQWDFGTSRLSVDPKAKYSASEPALTLYAMWVPLFQFDFYDLGTGEQLGSLTIDPRTENQLTLPHWDEGTGAMEMEKFPLKVGYTFNGVYADQAGTQKIEDVVTHTGSLDATTGQAQGAVMSLYVDWTEGTWYKITTADQFISNANPGGSYEILADLDFTGKIWPASLMYNNFAGTILGNGHTFSNITLDVTDNSRMNAGLFGTLTENVKLSQLTFENVTLNLKTGARMMGTSYGLLAGMISEKAVFEAVSVLGGSIYIDPMAYFMTQDYAIGLIAGAGTADLAQAQVENISDPEKWMTTEDGLIVPGTEQGAGTTTEAEPATEATEPTEVTEEATEATGETTEPTQLTGETIETSESTEEVTEATE